MKYKLGLIVLLLVSLLGFGVLPGNAKAAAQAPRPDLRSTATPLYPYAALDQSHLRPFHTLRYAALGDSVAAGLGLTPQGGSNEAQMCGRSTDAYAYEVSKRINARLQAITWGGLRMETALLACQQARTDHLTQPQTIAGQTLVSQLDQAFAKGTPALLTLTVGANDTDWANFINLCSSVDNCATPENTARTQAYIQAAGSKLAAALADIRSRSRFVPPLVVVTGYYNPVSTSCVTSIFTPDEVAWLQTQIDSLNTELRKVATDNGRMTRFAPVDFTGHDVCSPDTWLQRPFSGDPAPLHPTQRGQQVIAETVLGSLGL